VVTLGVAAAVFWIAYDDASYGVDRRNVLAVAVWWSILLLVALGIVPIRRLRGPTLIVAGLLLALALLTLASLAWSPSAEKTLHEVNRVTLYLGVVVLVTPVGPPGGARAPLCAGRRARWGPRDGRPARGRRLAAGRPLPAHAATPGRRLARVLRGARPRQVPVAGERADRDDHPQADPRADARAHAQADAQADAEARPDARAHARPDREAKVDGSARSDRAPGSRP